MQLAQALTRADSPAAREHIRAALAELDAPDRLIECRTCGRVGLPERLICTYCAED
jgi:ribosomal protein L32